MVRSAWGVTIRQKSTASSWINSGQFLRTLSHLTKSFDRTKGDTGIFFVDTTNWITSVSDLIPMDEHLSVSGNERVAAEFVAWLEKWDDKPLEL